MRNTIPAILAVVLLTLCANRAGAEPGWVSLFDGKTTSGWRSFRQKSVTPNWVVEDGCLHNVPAKKRHDLITEAVFDDFELEWDWKVAPRANSGVKYFITEERTEPIGHEYQMIDDDHYEKDKPSLRGGIHGTASLYDLLPPTNLNIMPVGEFNHSRIVVHGNHVEHWLNGSKTVDYELGGETLKSAIARSKFKNVNGFGDKIKAHILLQDHGDQVWFRNIRIKK